MALPRRHYAVLDPQVQVSTAELFQAPELTRNGPATTISSFVSGEMPENAFTSLVRDTYPQVAAALDWLGQYGPARLSGTGGCVFLETRSFARAHAVARRCPPRFVAQAVSGVTLSALRPALARHRAPA
jgi:4-diphosphocytidyl-2-C-methyl-D-erythritol kinase